MLCGAFGSDQSQIRLNMFLCPTSTLWSRWEVLPRIEMSLENILLSATPRTEPAFLINLSSMLVSTTVMFLHKQTRAYKMALTTDMYNIHSVTLKHLSLHRK